jgi:hypothetical protein
MRDYSEGESMRRCRSDLDIEFSTAEKGSGEVSDSIEVETFPFSY